MSGFSIKKLLKWIAIVIAAGIAALFAIGTMTSGTTQHASPQQTAAPAKQIPVPKRDYPADQCISGLCVGALPGELLGQSWDEPTVSYNNGLSSQQIEMLDANQNAIVSGCVRLNADKWGAKTEEMCRVFAKASDRRRTPLIKMLSYFTENPQPVCLGSAGDPIDFRGRIAAPDGESWATLRFDSQGMLRVYQVGKSFIDQSAATNSEIAAKLNEKHPYLTKECEMWHMPPRETCMEGDSAWGHVTLRQKQGEAPFVVMEANHSDFDTHAIPACSKPNLGPVNVN